MSEILYPSKRDWSITALVSLALCGASIWLGSGASPLWNCFSIVLLGGAAIVFLFAAAHLLPNSSFLKISSAGLTVRSFWRTTDYRWVDISEFGVAMIEIERGGIRSRHPRVGFNFSRYAPPLKRATAPERLSTRVGKYEAALPDTYGRDCAELAAYLTLQRAHFLGQTRVRGESTSTANVS